MSHVQTSGLARHVAPIDPRIHSGFTETWGDASMTASTIQETMCVKRTRPFRRATIPHRCAAAAGAESPSSAIPEGASAGYYACGGAAHSGPDDQARLVRRCAPLPVSARAETGFVDWDRVTLMTLAGRLPLYPSVHVSKGAHDVNDMGPAAAEKGIEISKALIELAQTLGMSPMATMRVLHRLRRVLRVVGSDTKVGSATNPTTTSDGAADVDMEATQSEKLVISTPDQLPDHRGPYFAHDKTRLVQRDYMDVEAVQLVTVSLVTVIINEKKNEKGEPKDKKIYHVLADRLKILDHGDGKAWNPPVPALPERRFQPATPKRGRDVAANAAFDGFRSRSSPSPSKRPKRK
ncbi:hypothetical protein GGX14DRAFT_564340 [Mycena pura]|uniref:Uncharacterized protein n=1 Tax=Mycena pura TaxID=153505 RepID=A0AAD6VP62_9AGAR|nr:hypothetical protein GGX14DRAFT_564340 [Mycena pura]